MNEAQGEQHSASPEHGLIHGSLEIEEVLAMLSLNHEVEASRQEPLSSYLYGLREIFTNGQVHNGLIHDYEGLSRLDFGQAEQKDFWVEYGVRIEALKADLYASYIEEVAGEMAFHSQFLFDNPRLIRVGSPDGPFLTGIDMEFNTPTKAYAARRHDEVIAYTGGDAPAPVERGTKLFVQLDALNRSEQAAMKNYCQETEIPPYEA